MWFCLFASVHAVEVDEECIPFASGFLSLLNSVKYDSFKISVPLGRSTVF